ncbi:unnamed protein product [Lepidochelys olivacea]
MPRGKIQWALRLSADSGRSHCVRYTRGSSYRTCRTGTDQIQDPSNTVPCLWPVTDASKANLVLPLVVEDDEGVGGRRREKKQEGLKCHLPLDPTDAHYMEQAQCI